MSLDGKKGVDDHDCLCMPTYLIVSRRQRETAIVLKTMKADDHDGLRIPSDLIVSGWQKRLNSLGQKTLKSSKRGR